MGELIFYFIFTVFTSFLSSLTEGTLLSTSLSFLVSEEQKGRKRAKRLVYLKKHIDKPITGILTLNTIANTFGSALVGAKAASILGNELLGVISAVLTLSILFIAEILPKTLGANYWRRLIFLLYPFIELCIILTYPITMLNLMVMRRLFKRNSISTVSRDEIASMASIGHKEGVVEKSENLIIHNVFKLNQTKIKELTTPRTVVIAAPANITISQFFRSADFLKFSRVPIYDGKIDQIVGYVLKNDILQKVATGQDKQRLSSIKRDVLVAYENFTIPRLFDELMRKKEHLAVVVDEYGALSGVITLEDIIESLLGLEIMDEKDSQVDMQQYAREQWKAKANRLGYTINKEENE